VGGEAGGIYNKAAQKRVGRIRNRQKHRAYKREHAREQTLVLTGIKQKACEKRINPRDNFCGEEYELGKTQAGEFSNNCYFMQAEEFSNNSIKYCMAYNLSTNIPLSHNYVSDFER
jgi:hypothetical protein